MRRTLPRRPFPPARVILPILISLLSLLLPPLAWGQQASGIAGVVKDESGAVLPGVTVEAASPVLIEKVRTVFTDGQGQYNIVDLRPGTYTVTFTLPGFSTVRREGLALTAGFTATVNADLQLGALEETVTVTGEAPVVDTRNASQQRAITNAVLEQLPVGNVSFSTLVAVTPGFTGGDWSDVGGTRETFNAQGGYGLFHGKHGVKTQYDGMRIQNFSSGQGPGLHVEQPDRRGDAAADGRDLGGGHLHRDHDEPDPENGQQQLPVHGDGAVVDRRHAGRQPERRPARPGRDDEPDRQEHL